MRTTNTQITLVLAFVSSLFAGCAADIEMGSEQVTSKMAPQPVEEAACTTGVLPATGCADYGDLKMQSYEACEQAGLQLVNISIKIVEGCDNQTAGAVDYQCCPAAPPPDPVECTNEPNTTGTLTFATCQGYADLKMAAWQACEQEGRVLFNLTPDGTGCPEWEGTSVAYECAATNQCAPPHPEPDPGPTPPPEPGVCTTDTITYSTCQTYSDIKMATWEACNQAGSTLIDLTTDAGTCADGTAISVTYKCLSGGNYCP
ncbi:MAG TPA: hypothetical protein PK156_21895 [Polyangium sp.]|nr:hypothetical protein [Polyangium sp.]